MMIQENEKVTGTIGGSRLKNSRQAESSVKEENAYLLTL